MTSIPKVTKFDKFLEQIYRRHSGNIKYDLERIISIMKVMGDPQTKLKGIHVGGTNGKGSTSAITEAICLSHDRTTGLNTSPHLVDYRERFRVNGINITKRDLMWCYNQWSGLFEENEASFFEITTAIAFYYFHHLQLDTSIFEVGLGGRLDATNPFNATVSVITSIAIDHPKTLGDTIEKIAFEKAGIIKQEVPLVLGNLPVDALRVIKETARQKSAPVYQFGKDFAVERVQMNGAETTFDYHHNLPIKNLPVSFNNLQVSLLGRHQAINSALAITAYALYSNILNEPLDPDKVLKGLRTAKWQGRMQIIGDKPLTILDCAHNEEGIENLIINLETLFPGIAFRFVIAILRDKNIDGMISRLCSTARKLYITKNSSDRAADIKDQTDIAARNGVEYSTEESIISALNNAIRESCEDDIIVVTGSIYTVSEIIALMGRKRYYH